jgi:recA bacterial DNA recombination protein
MSSKSEKRTRFEQTVAAVQSRYSVRSLRPAREVPLRFDQPHVATGFAALDAITGCGGIPLGAITLLSGKSTSGKLTLAYKVLCNLQRPSRAMIVHNVAVLDQTYTLDPDYMVRCGLDLEHVLIVRPQTAQHAVDLMRDLVSEYPLGAVLVEDLPEIRANEQDNRYFDAALPQLHMLYQRLGCALIVLDEPHPPWQRLLPRGRSAIGNYVGLHVDLQHEQWERPGGKLKGYRAIARVVKSRWARSGGTALLEIIFNGTVRAAPTW